MGEHIIISRSPRSAGNEKESYGVGVQSFSFGNAVLP